MTEHPNASSSCTRATFVQICTRLLRVLFCFHGSILSIAAKQISWQEGGRNRGSQRRGSLELSKPKEGYVADNRHPKGGYTVFCLKVFFSAWGSFPCYLLHFGAKNMCFACILKLESPICVPTWLLAFGFWLHLASLGFAWLRLAYGSWLLAFGFWSWFWPFTSLGSWRLLGFSIVVCI